MRVRSRMPAGVGAMLRQTRIRAGIQLGDVQAQSGIKAKYLRALEWERFDLLPSFDYARRAAQAEARVLQLDPEATVAELDRTIATLPRHGATEHAPADPSETVSARLVGAPPVTSPEPIAESQFIDLLQPASDPQISAEPAELPVQPSWSEPAAASSETSRVPSHARRLLIGALLGGLAAFLIVDLLVLRDEDSSSSPAAVSQPTTGESTPLPAPQPQPATNAADDAAGIVAPGAAADTTQPARPADEPGATGQGGDPDAGAGAAAGAEPGSDETPGTGQGGAGSESAGSADGAARPAGVQKIEIAAPRGESWLQVRRGSGTGPVLYEGILAAGETLSFDERKLFARVGAVSAVDIRQDGTLVSEGLEGTLDFELTRANGFRVVS